jgi:hypothetical protein
MLGAGEVPAVGGIGWMAVSVFDGVVRSMGWLGSDLVVRAFVGLMMAAAVRGGCWAEIPGLGEVGGGGWMLCGGVGRGWLGWVWGGRHWWWVGLLWV